MFEIDFIYINDSQLLHIMNEYAENNDELVIHQYPMMSFKQLQNSHEPIDVGLPDKFHDIVILEELDSFIETEEIYDMVLQRMSDDAIKIIMTANHNFYNVVQWMRKGATDVLLTSTLTEKVLLNSIIFSQVYTHSKSQNADIGHEDNSEEKIHKQYADGRVILPKDYNWQSVPAQDDFNMTVLMITFSFDKRSSIYTALNNSQLYETAKNEVAKLTKYFGGLLWFWNRNTGALAFHFGDHVNTAITASIHFVDQVVLTYIERLKMKDIPNFMISVHTGTDMFTMTGTEDLHSNIVNFASHLLTKYTPENSICISDDVYNKLSVRLKSFFAEYGSFEGHNIYKY